MLLRLLEKIGRKRTIYDRLENEPYLIRYYLFLKDRKWFPFNVFLHKFMKGDPDELHDHPWPYATLILKGGYWEITPNGRHWRGPGSFRLAGSNSLHRVELEPGIHAWTLFMPGPKLREWGFIVKGKWMQHEKYFAWRKEQAQDE